MDKAIEAGAIQDAFLELPWSHRGDPTHMEYVLELIDTNDDTKGKLLANGLETLAAIHSAIAKGAESAAAILRGGDA